MTTPAPRPSQDPRRDALLKALIAGGIACGLWYVAIRPLEESLAQSRSTLVVNEQRLTVHQASTTRDSDLGGVASELAHRAQSMQAFVDRWGDAGTLYESFRSMARAAGVRLERVEPRGVTPIPGASRSAKSPGDILQYSLELSGTYAQIASFLDECEHSLGASKITSFRISPLNRPMSGGDQVLSAAVDTSHIRLNIPAEPVKHDDDAPGKTHS